MMYKLSVASAARIVLWEFVFYIVMRTNLHVLSITI